MSRLKQTSKARGRRSYCYGIGSCWRRWSVVAGQRLIRFELLRLAIHPTQNAAPVILAEEEVSDVSLSTFFVFDKENARPHLPGVQLAGEGVATGVDMGVAAVAVRCTEAAVAAAAAQCTEAAAAASEGAQGAVAAAEAAAYGLEASGIC